MMTEAQQTAVKRIEDIMREHFDAGIAVLRADDETNDEIENTDVVWHGGFAHAIGLLVVGKRRMLKKKKKK